MLNMKFLFQIFILLVSSGIVKSAALNTFPIVPNVGQVSDQYFKLRPDVFYVAQASDLQYAFKTSAWSIQQFRFSNAKSNTANMLHAAVKSPARHQLEVYRTDWTLVNSNMVNPKAYIISPDYDVYYNETCPLGTGPVYRYATLKYANVYADIDLVFDFQNQNLKYQFEVKTPQTYTNIVLQCKGADTIYINTQGQLVIKTPFGLMIDEKPIVFQNGSKLKAEWILTPLGISFYIPFWNPKYPLIIDPLVRSWGTYYGGSFTDYMSYTCTDKFNNVIASGYTESPTTLNLASSGAHQSTYGGAGASNYPGDAFLVKLNSQGQRLWGTYYGGSGNEFSNMVCADTLGNIYMVGGTSTTNTAVIATPGAYQQNYAGGSNNGDGFIVKFNSAGQRIWGTYYGDSGDDWMIGACINTFNQLYVCGGAWSVNSGFFGSVGSYQPQHYGTSNNADAYISKFTANGQRIWSTYFGASGYDNAHYCIVDAQDRLTILGATSSTETAIIASAGAYQPQYGGGTNFGDILLAQFNGNGQRLWSTYYGAADDEYASSGLYDNQGNIVVTGITSSTTSAVMTSTNAFQAQYGGGNYDAFMAKFTSNGQRSWGTYVGGPLLEDWPFVAIDAQSNLYLTGATASSVGLSTSCSYQEQFGGGTRDMFFSKWNLNGAQLWSSYFGGTGAEGVWPCIAVDSNLNLYLTGSSTTPTGTVIASPGSQQPFYASNNNLNSTAWDGFIVKFPPCQAQTPAVIAQTVVCSATRAVLTAAQNCGLRWYDAATGGSLMSSAAQFTTPVLTSNTAYYVEDVSCGVSSARSMIQLAVLASPSIMVTASKNPICKGESVVLSVTGAAQFNWTGLGSSTSTVFITPSVTAIYTVVGTASNSCTDTKTLGLVVNPCSDIIQHDSDVFQLYPNPVSDGLHVVSNSQEMLIILDVHGKIIMQYESKANTTYIDIHAFKPGVYFILNNTGRISHKFIKL